MRNNNSIIPHAIRNIEPKMTTERFIQKKDDIFFRERKANVCEECYLEISKSNYFTKAQYMSKLNGENIRLTAKSHELYVKEEKHLRKDKSIKEIKENRNDTNSIILPNYLNINNNNNTKRLLSAVGNKISINRTRNSFNTFDSKNYKSSYCNKRSESTATGRTINKTILTKY